jgi:DNA-binding transcriptional LysR family regulator
MIETQRFGKRSMALPDFEAWAIFSRVADAGSFAAAARELNLSKATVSKAVARLEARLGAALLHRTSRRLSLTDAGRASLERAARILSEGEAIEAEASAQAVEPHGVIRVAAPIAFGVQHIAPLLAAFMQLYPGVTIDLRLSDEFIDIVGEGFDMAFRIAALQDSSLRARRICGIRRPLVGSPAYFDRNGRPAHPRDLEGHDALLYAYLSPADIWTLRHPQLGEYSVRVKCRMMANNADALGPALLAGLGVAIQPEFFVDDDLRAGRLESVLDDWSMTPVSFYVLTPPGRLRPARVSLLIDHLVDHFIRKPWAMAA